MHPLTPVFGRQQQLFLNRPPLRCSDGNSHHLTLLRPQHRSAIQCYTRPPRHAGTLPCLPTSSVSPHAWQALPGECWTRPSRAALYSPPSLRCLHSSRGVSTYTSKNSPAGMGRAAPSLVATPLSTRHACCARLGTARLPGCMLGPSRLSQGAGTMKPHSCPGAWAHVALQQRARAAARAHRHTVSVAQVPLLLDRL